VQERAFRLPYIHERGLHAWQNRAHNTFVDVTDDAPALPVFHQNLNELVVFENGYPRLAARHVNDNFLVHITPLYGGPRPTVW